jgi:hypothetical protein
MKVSIKTTKLLACCLAMLGLSSSVLAQSTTLATNVNVTFTPQCQFTSAAQTFTVNYTAFQTTDEAPTALTPAVRCSFGATTPTYSWSTLAAGAVTATTPAVTLKSTVAGLAYTLTATPSAVTGGAAATGITGATPMTGTVALDLLIPKDQAGQSGVSASAAATLTIAF